MKAFTFIHQRMSARIFATLTILSLLLSAFPAAFFVAEAASTGVSVNHSTLTTEVNQQVNFVVSTILDSASSTDNTYILLSDDSGGEFFNGTTNGACNDGDPETDKTFAIDKDRAVCYSNAAAGTYTISVQLIAGGAGPAIGNPATVEITVNDEKPEIPTPVYGCMDDSATNFDSAATEQGEVLCEYPSSDSNTPTPVYGCMDDSATNYNPAATVNIPERCTYPEPEPSCVNLLENGSFEEPVVINTEKWQKFATVSGWIIGKVSDGTPTTLELHRDWSSNEAADGEQYSELDGDLSSKISQVVTTIPNATYELSWAFAPRHGITAEQNQLSVLVDGAIVDSEGPLTGSADLDPSDWVRSSYSFTANDADAEITFADAGPSDSYGTFLDDARLCLVKESEPKVEVVATKIVCDDESLLPNWAAGAPKIDADTASGFLSSSPERAEGCHLVNDWQFEWAPKNTADPGDTLVGTAGTNWTTFTNSTEIPLSAIDDGFFWMREVLQSNYIPFTHEKEGNKNTDDVTAEFYCHTDGLNYDNFDRIDGPKADQTYYCVAWNVLAKSVDEGSDVTMCKYDNYENLLSGWQLSLTGTTSNQSLLKTAELVPSYVGTTTENGCVVFENVPYGEYVVGETMQEGWENQYGLGAVVVDEETEQFNVMNRQIPPPETYMIDGYKHEVIGTTTVPRAGWVISLEDDGTVIATTTTNSEGYYSFEVEEGYYEVREMMKTDWEQVKVERNGYTLESEGDAYCGFEVYDYKYEYSRYMSEYEYDYDGYTCDFYNKFVGVDEPEEPEEPTKPEEPSRRHGGSSGTKIKKPAPQVLGASTNNFCPLITDYMQIGWNNDPLEVMKLQMFLNMFKNTFGGVTNPVNGEFGTTTDANVKAFQEKYRSEVLDPWFNQGIVPHNRPTGFVYKTTLWKINSIVCPDYAITPDFTGENLSSNTDID